MPEGVIKTLTVSCDRIPIPLGRQGENAARRVRFSMKDFAPFLSLPVSSPDETPQVSLLVRRPGESAEAPYPVPLTFEEEDGIPRSALWTPSCADTALYGPGECELRLTAGETLVKSRRYPFTVEKALGQAAEPPAPWQPWVNGVLDAAERAQTAADALTEEAETISRNAEEIEVLQRQLTLKAPAGGLCKPLTAGSALRLADPEAQSVSLQTGDAIDLTGTGLRSRAIGQVKAVFGQTCVKNQLCDPQGANTGTGSGVTYTNNRDGTWTLTGSGTGTNRKPLCDIHCIPGHKYYLAHGSETESDGSWYLCVTYNGSHLIGTGQNARMLLTASYAFDALSVRTTSGFRAPEEGITLRPVLVDLTLLCGEGHEPGTADEALRRFPEIEKWDYDTGSLLHMNAAGLVCRAGNTADEKSEASPPALDFSDAIAEYFPGGMMSVQEVRDELNENFAIRRCALADGAVVPLAEPVITPLFPPLSLTLPLYEGRRLDLVTAEGIPTAPARLLMTPLPDVTRAVKNLPRDYISLQSLDALLSVLESTLGISLTRAWDETEEKWVFTGSGS